MTLLLWSVPRWDAGNNSLVPINTPKRTPTSYEAQHTEQYVASRSILCEEIFSGDAIYLDEYSQQEQESPLSRFWGKLKNIAQKYYIVPTSSPCVTCCTLLTKRLRTLALQRSAYLRLNIVIYIDLRIVSTEPLTN